jgi:hypothetical protein
MSAFPQSGRSDHGNSQISRVRFRPEADTENMSKSLEIGALRVTRQDLE